MEDPGAVEPASAPTVNKKKTFLHTEGGFLFIDRWCGLLLLTVGAADLGTRLWLGGGFRDFGWVEDSGTLPGWRISGLWLGGGFRDFGWAEDSGTLARWRILGLWLRGAFRDFA